jgi:queuine tRNA-ribosyltransferase
MKDDELAESRLLTLNAEVQDKKAIFSFEISAEDRRARTGRLSTPHGLIETPAFVPVATRAAIPGLSAGDLKAIGVQMLITNAYHLHLQPGEEVIRAAGGLQRFMGWKGPVMIDSGGFQIFSLGAGRKQGLSKVASRFSGFGREQRPPVESAKPLVRVDEAGAEFISYRDGSRHRFTPEGVVETGLELGADLIMPLDECTSPLYSYGETRAAMERTHRWALRSLDVFQRRKNEGQALFGIVQGGDFEDLRRESARFAAAHGFDGLAIGGYLGQSQARMTQVLGWTIPHLPAGKPRHLLGIGWVEDVLAAVEQGIDLLDCAAPTRLALTGTLLAKREKRFRLRIRNEMYRKDQQPVEEDCPCAACRDYSRAYLRHLFMVREPLGVHLAVRHNLHFMESLMKEIRSAIKEGKLGVLIREWGNYPGQ